MRVSLLDCKIWLVAIISRFVLRRSDGGAFGEGVIILQIAHTVGIYSSFHRFVCQRYQQALNLHWTFASNLLLESEYPLTFRMKLCWGKISQCSFIFILNFYVALNVSEILKTVDVFCIMSVTLTIRFF